jgi:hypothetical protein
LDGLVRLGYLKSKDARAFAGVKIVFHGDADETHPQRILVETAMPDGILIAVMGDGSVQQFSPQRYEAYKREVGEVGQPGGAANGSQPVRGETNRTSSAAGSRR